MGIILLGHYVRRAQYVFRPCTSVNTYVYTCAATKLCAYYIVVRYCQFLCNTYYGKSVEPLHNCDQYEYVRTTYLVDVHSTYVTYVLYCSFALVESW